MAATIGKDYYMTVGELKELLARHDDSERVCIQGGRPIKEVKRINHHIIGGGNNAMPMTTITTHES